VWLVSICCVRVVLVRGLAGHCGEWDIIEAAQYAASGGHTAVVDLLAGEFGAWIFVGCLIRAALWGHDAMIVRRLSFITRVSSSLSMMEPRGQAKDERHNGTGPRRGTRLVRAASLSSVAHAERGRGRVARA